MNKLTCFLMAIMLGFLLTATASIEPANAQTDLNAFLGQTIPDSQIDGNIGAEWNDADNHTGAQELALNPQGHVDMWVKHDGTYLYIALTFNTDSNNPWVAIMFSSADHMTRNTDGALFGHDGYASNGYADISFGGVGIISKDASQEGKGAIRISVSNQVAIELKKPLNSGDSVGKDIAWAEGNTYALTVMWDTNGGGSSGGAVNHYEGSLFGETIFINSSQIPEFSGSIFILVTMSIGTAIILLRRRKVQTTTKI